MNKPLVESIEYYGKYVALKSIDNNEIVGVGDTPQIAINEAAKKGFSNPLIVYIPEKDVDQIYDIGWKLLFQDISLT